MQRRIARGVGDAAPYETNKYGSVGANSVRPGNLALSFNCTGAHCAPLQRNFRRFLAPEGSIGEK